MKTTILAVLTVISTAAAVSATEFHVATSGKDANPGRVDAPFRTIQRAAELAQPGDTITVHAGVYRERINPPRGGTSDRNRITYRAAPGERVEIRGSEAIKSWVRDQGDVWKVTLPNSFFGAFNPYGDRIHGDWFDPKGRDHHTGAVYLNGDWLTEAAKLDELMSPAGRHPEWFTRAGGNARGALNPRLWFGQAGPDSTTIWAQFPGVDPNKQEVEINVRQTVFRPEKTGVNDITVSGFTMKHAATPWAPPTAGQIGVIGPHWSKGWIIENNQISYSTCSGISLGKYGDRWDNTSADTAEGYVATIERALKDGWNKATIGHHIVRANIISHCEQAGIVGSLGAAFSTIEGNVIHDIHVRQLFSGAEMAGIKFHGAIDVQLVRNHIYRTCLGLWLDWMAQGTRVSRNLFHENYGNDLFVEVDHGPFLVDNNIFLSPGTLLSVSQGGAYVHNLIGGRLLINPFDARKTPFHKPHSTELAGMADNPSGDDRYLNNLFVGSGDLSPYNRSRLPAWMDGNVFIHGAKPSHDENAPLVDSAFDPGLELTEKPDGFWLAFRFDDAWMNGRSRPAVTTKLLGKVAISGLPYEAPDGAPIQIDADYFGKPRDASNPTPGPFERPGTGPLTLRVWPF